MNFNEEKTIAQLRNPETRRKAFEMVVNTYSQPIYWQIRRMVYSHDDANDLVQNTFIKAWNNLDTFRADAKLNTWLYRIALNETLNFLQRRKTMVAIDDPTLNVEQQLLSDDYFDGDETQLQLEKAVAQLPEKQRTVFQLKYFQEMKYEDMSQLLNTSVGALKSSYFHAVKKISDYFNLND